MTWITDNKGSGPWEFTEQGDKWGYLNNPRWSNHPKAAADPMSASEFCEGKGISLDPTHTHKPCGHWHKQKEDETVSVIETYIELLSTGISDSVDQLWQVDGEYGEDGPIHDVTYLPTFRALNTADYDGTVTYIFEAVCQNKSEANAGYIYLVNSSDAIVATLEIPAQTWGPIGPTSAGGYTRAGGYFGSDYYVFQTTFTPSGDDEYGLRVMIPNSGFLSGWSSSQGILRVVEATIIIRQTGPTASGVHIPMMTDAGASQLCYVDIPAGEHILSNGQESLTTAITKYIGTYEDCEDSENALTQIRQVWKYDENELSTVNKIVFDAGIGYRSPNIDESETQIVGEPDLSLIKLDLRWCETGGLSPANFASGEPGDAIAIDGSGREFHYINNSYATWNQCDDSSEWELRIYLDIDSLMAANGHYIYVCSQENIYGSCLATSGYYHHWYQLRHFEVTRTVERAWIDYKVSYNDDRGDEIVYISFCYDTDYDVNPGYIILYDKTADEYISESELTWNAWTPWERKSVELSPSLFTSGHEYIARWKSGTEYASTYSRPYVSDINLWIYVTDMNIFTSFRRVTKNTVRRHSYIYSDWYNDGEGYGVISVHSRSKLYLSDDVEIYYECCAFDWGQYEESFAELWDAGPDDANGIGSNPVGRLSESQLSFGMTLDGFTYRVRSEQITLATNGNYYVDYLPGATLSAMTVYFPLSGFIVVKYPKITSSSPSYNDEPQVWPM